MQPAVERLPSVADPRVLSFHVEDEVDVHVVVTTNFVALIDTTGNPATCQQVVDAVLADPGWERLRERPWITINTHADWDHVWGNSAVADFAPIIAHEHALARLQAEDDGLRTLRDRQSESKRFANVRLVEPNITFAHELTLRGGDLTLELIHLPGHTDDHIVVWIPEIAMCFAGDAVEDPIPEITVPTGGNLRLMFESLRQLRHLRPRWVLAGHGRTASPELIDQNLAYFTRVVGRVRALPPRQRASASLPGLSFNECVQPIRTLSRREDEFYRSCHDKTIEAASRLT